MSCLWEKLRDLNYSLQVATKVALERDEELRNDYLEAVEWACTHVDQLVYVDETAKDRNSARRRRYYSKRGQTPVASEMFHGADVRYTMLAAADIDGFILPACEVVLRETGPNDGCNT